MPATRSALVGQVAAAQVDARDLEQRDPAGAGIDVAPRRLDEAREERRCVSAVSSTEIGSGSFHGVSSSGRRLGV